MSGNQQVASVLTGPKVERTVPYGLAGLIRERSRAAPDRTALVAAEGTMSYAELETASDRVARALAAAGAVPGDVVAVCLPRGTAMVVALLGALKAGAAYLPLALDDPPERRAVLVRSSGVRAGLATAGSRALLESAGVTRVLDVEETGAGGALAPVEWDEPRPCAADHPAYVLHTSGSTGAPKGVVVPSLALCNRLLWMCEEYGFRPADRILQKTPYTFDVSGWEFWAPLISGGRLVLLPPEAHHDPGEMIEWITAHEVTVCHFVPSMLEEFLRWPGAERCGSLRAVMCSGEVLTPGQVRRFGARLPGAALHNLYGPTEAAIDVTSWPCPAPGEPMDRVLIGRPISNCALLVVADDLSPVAEGGTGQLAIGGQPLAIGYLGRPDLTAAAFVEAPPWSPVPRLYLTGDLVRVRGGALEYLGRADGQVKIRGQRVDPGAVEDTLRDSGWVRDAAVVPVSAGHSVELAAFVVPAAQAPAGEEVLSALRQDLQARLPSSHRPARYLLADAIPLTSSGKTDRGALVRRAEEAALQDRRDLPPHQDTDELTACWADAVGRPPERPDLGFLQAGGHSLAAVRLAGSVLRRWGVRVPLSAFLRDDLSLDGLRRLLPDRPPADRSALPRRPDPDRAELLPDQRRMWLHQQIFPDSPAYNVVGVLDCRGLLDADTLQRAWTRLVADHEILRTSIEGGDGEAYQRVHPAGTVVREIADLRVEHAGGGHWDTRVQDFTASLADTLFPPDRPRRSVLGLLTDPARCRSALVLVLDHLVSDQRSLDLLLDALARRYAAEATGGNPDAEGIAAPVQYGDVIAARRADPRRCSSDREYWRKTLAGAVPELALPFQDRPPQPSFRGAAVEEDLGPKLSGLVRQLARARRVSPTMLLLACYVRVLADWSGQTEVTVGVPVSGRDTEDAQDAAGFFMRTLPVRVGTPAGAGADRLLEPVADALLAAVDHGSLPFDEIVAAVGASRDLARNPLFQVWFNDVTQAAPPTSFGGLPATPVSPEARWSLFDVGLYVHLGPDGGYRLQLAHATDLWSRDVACEFLHQCVTELRALTLLPAAPSRPAARRMTADRPLDTCTDLVLTVLDHGKRNAARPALRCGGRTVDYGALAFLVRRAATRIRRVAPPGSPVAVLAERHSDLAQGVLGAWCAGNPVLLLDAAAPQEWIQSALAAGGAEAVVTLGDTAPAPAGLPAVPVGPAALQGVDPWPGLPDRLPAGEPGHALATSGTSGHPAVVVLPAEALPESFTAYADSLGLGADDRFCFTVPPGHDPVFRDLLLPLVLGATVTVPEQGEDHDPRALLDLLDRSGTTIWHTTPSRARIAAAVAAHGHRLPALRHVVLHGERLRTADARDISRLCPDARLHNLYGATETPQASGLARWSDRPGDSVPVVAALPHRSLGVRTARGQDAPVGVVGELVVTGRGLAIGYLGDGGRRAPAVVDRGRYGEAVSVHRTGDLARRTPDGLIDIVGRKDRQVSVFGYRVELSGVERALAAVPGIRDCVAGTEEPDGTGGLAAWFTAARVLDPADVRAAMRSRLPDWALPSRLVQVEQLPLTRNGKVDLVALRTLRPRPEPAQHGPGAPALAEAIAARASAFAAERLGADHPITPDTEFHRAGLTSLDLLHLHRLLVAEDGLSLPLADVFRCPTPRRLAAAAVGPTAGTTAQPTPRPGSGRPPGPPGGGELARRRAARARFDAGSPSPTTHPSRPGRPDRPGEQEPTR